MDPANCKGQILIEICLVMALIITVGFAALDGITTQRDRSKKFQFTDENRYVSKTKFKNKK